ncbi:FISUMP domain-containing protein [Parabacteroides segnis]|uniref:FISUMP domain-containing protein n=1 Tax=Parabacteroides segnis TaxID=2763058 RepID=UPI0035184AB2
MITINMKQYLFILLSFLLASCAEQEIGREEPGGIPGEGFRLSVRLGNGIATRALGDPFDSAGDEKRIDRLAFFVHTDEDGFQVYPPVPDDVTDATAAATDHPHNVYLTETAPGSGQYTADVTLTAGGGYMADIVAVANLPKDYDYNQIVTWDGLQDSVAVWATANLLPATAGTATEMPSCTPGANLADPARRAFAMYGYTREELVKEETNAFTLTLERLVARIDITNEAYEPGMTAADPKGGFLLTSVRVLQARPASYITPQPGYASPDVATISDWQMTDIPYGKATAADATVNPTREPDAVNAAAAETDATLQYLWRTLYTYENSDTEHAPTALEIKGNFRGTEVTRRIDFIDADKQPVPLVRNHRYLVRILPAPGQTDITFDIKVAEWDAVDTVQVKPDQTEVPEIAHIDGNVTPNLISEVAKTYDVYYTQDGELTFEATCSFAPGIRVKYYDNLTDSWTTKGDWLTIEQVGSTEIVTKATPTYKNSYQVTFNKFDGGVTRKAMLLVHNGGSEVECDTILVRHVVTYPGTDLEAVEYKGRFWAPVNVGGTIDLTTVDKITEDTADDAVLGYMYQWGRNVPFSNAIPPSTVEIINAADFPIYTEACSNTGTYQNKFILSILDVDFSWHKDYRPTAIAGLSPELSVDDNYAWPRKSQPCPAGWRVPGKTEYEAIAAEMEENKEYQKDGKWVSKQNNKFVLPAAGMRYHTDATLRSRGKIGHYWTSGLYSIGRSPWLQFKDSEGRMGNSEGNASACSIRCIQE